MENIQRDNCSTKIDIVHDVQGHANVRKWELADTDGYTRLNHVTQLHVSSKGHDSIYARGNAPFGGNLHSLLAIGRCKRK